MSNEENISSGIRQRFALQEGALSTPAVRRINLEIEYARLRQVLDYLVKEAGFGMLCAITGIDNGTQIEVIYHLSSIDGTVISVKTKISRQEPRIESVTDCFPSADIYEREMVDLLGLEVNGLAQGNRYPLTDDWPKGQYPLRKDWKPAADGGQKAGV